MRARYVLISKFSELTGYSEKAVRRKIEARAWLQNREWRKLPDGHVLVDLDEPMSTVEVVLSELPELSSR